MNKFIFQSFGIAEGRRLQDVKDMAEAAGQTFPGFTPPGGETQEQVRLRLSYCIRRVLVKFWITDNEK